MSNPHHTLTQDSRIFHHPTPNHFFLSSCQPPLTLTPYHCPPHLLHSPPHPRSALAPPSPSPGQSLAVSPLNLTPNHESHFTHYWFELQDLSFVLFLGVFFFWFNRFRIFFFFYYLISFFSSHMIFRFSLWVFVRESFFWVWSFVCYFLLLSRCTFLYLDG